MKIDGRFWLTKDSESFLGSGRIELLEKIDKFGSINAAAKEMKMSYKAAWERINSMNNLADEPLITRTVGGKGGGGSVITPYAHKLIATYHRFNELHREFINRFAEAGDSPERLARILSRTFLTTSARNQLASKINAINSDGLNTKLSLSLTGGNALVSNITAKSVYNMGLDVGHDVYAIIKSSDINVVAQPPLFDENLNILVGTIKEIEFSKENIELTFALDEDVTLTALLHKTEDFSLKVGDKAYALILASNIIIGA